jgi:hypothetical protein
MESVINALADIIEGAPALDQSRECRVDSSDAPACVQRLVKAMCDHSWQVSLLAYGMNQNASGRVVGLDETFELMEDLDFSLEETLAQAGADHGPLDLAATLWLAPDGGGMSFLGLSWSGGILSFVVVEFDEDPNMDGLVKHLTTPGALFEYLDNYLESDAHDRTHVELLKAAAVDAGDSMERIAPVLSIMPS